MWKTQWAAKKTNQYEPARKRFVTIVLRVPQSNLTEFEMPLRQLIKQYNQDVGGVSGAVLINIIGERRLKAEYK